MADTDEKDWVISTDQSQVPEDILTNENIEVTMDTNEEEKRSIKIIKTVFVYMVSFGVGYCIAIVGPCLLEFQLLLGTTLQQTTFLFTARSFGYFIGSFSWGAGMDKFDNQFILGTCLLGAAITGASVPWCTEFVLIILVMAAWGFFTGGLETASNASCIKIWGKNSEPMLQGHYLCFAVGATVAPLIAGPFLTPIESESNMTSPSPSPSLETSPHQLQDNQSGLNNAEDLDYEGTLWVPFTLISIFLLIVAVPFFSMFVRNGCVFATPKSRNSNPKTPTRPKKETNIFNITLLVLLFFFSFFYTGHEIGYGGFIFTFAVESDFAFSVKQASYLNAAFWGSFAASRVLGIFCATGLAPRTMLIIDLCGMCIASSLLAIFGGTVVEVLWGATILLGVSLATVFPSIMLWADRYIRLTGKRMATFIMAASVSEMVLPLLLGFLLATVSIMMLMYVTLGMTLSTAICFIILQIMGSWHGERSKEIEDIEPESSKDICDNEMATVNTTYIDTDFTQG
ncbi:sodium-dependent glucose transporter 1C-like [Glandiceps talaboti]